MQPSVLAIAYTLLQKHNYKFLLGVVHIWERIIPSKLTTKNIWLQGRCLFFYDQTTIFSTSQYRMWPNFIIYVPHNLTQICLEKITGKKHLCRPRRSSKLQLTQIGEQYIIVNLNSHGQASKAIPSKLQQLIGLREKAIHHNYDYYYWMINPWGV